MPLTNEAEVIARPQNRKKTATACYHCGQPCLTDKIAIADKLFCCDGCKLVYEILNEKDLCDYYKLQQHPGLSQIKAIRKDKYAYLDDETIATKLLRFTDGELGIVTLYIPSIHCSSCMWLLEHLDRINAGVRESRVNFSAKEITIHFYRKKVSLRSIVELLTTIGYEPYISLEDINEKAAKSLNKQRIIKLGIAGFCFGNIMMMSFPEYLSEKTGIEEQYTYLFRYLNLGLSLPVFFYAASEFFHTAWTGLKQKILNIDAPIVLALIITFARSIYEILSGTGAGYLDSMSGIVFFMLAGRIVQERTYKSLSFTRDYKSYFPIAVNVKTVNGIVSTQLSDLKKDDIVVLHHDEIIPADSVVLNENAFVDYSFVTGEAEPVRVNVGEKVYAGGRQTGEELLIKVEKPIAGSYLTSLWNHFAFRRNKEANNDKDSVIHLLSKYFTVILFTLAAGTATYWYFNDPSKIINAVSAMLIVACPCALLLSATFTNSNILRILSLNGLFLRDATVIEQIAATDHIVFDKTGTLTKGNTSVTTSGHQLTDAERDMVYSVARQSNHPNSKALTAWLEGSAAVALDSWKETPGQGLQATIGNTRIIVGSALLADAPADIMDEKASLYIRINDKLTSVHLNADVREGIPGLTAQLRDRYKLSLLSGDNDKQRSHFATLLGGKSELLFNQKPLDKLSYIEKLQEKGEKVMMIGDGLNDAGALQQANVGITLADDVNNFTPACDAIFNAEKLSSFARLIQMAKHGGHIINISFVISIVYNFVGLWFAMNGMMKPVTAAILMPCSTLSIVIISSGLSNLIAWKNGLRIRS
ncbi:MAG: heavy metal translocating P-type ATPase metal-binding domain-containing protein [Taibaiella sp.]|nr:heavy metal translocating P-type ATPase metal-binding domain-containing protein [Taibaiella sp.]